MGLDCKPSLLAVSDTEQDSNLNQKGIFLDSHLEQIAILNGCKFIKRVIDR